MLTETCRFEFAGEYGTTCHDLTCHNRCLDPRVHVPSHLPDLLCSELVMHWRYTRPHHPPSRHSGSHYHSAGSLNSPRGGRCATHPPLHLPPRALLLCLYRRRIAVRLGASAAAAAIETQI